MTRTWNIKASAEHRRLWLDTVQDLYQTGHPLAGTVLDISGGLHRYRLTSRNITLAILELREVLGEWRRMGWR